MRLVRRLPFMRLPGAGRAHRSPLVARGTDGRRKVKLPGVRRARMDKALPPSFWTAGQSQSNARCSGCMPRHSRQLHVIRPLPLQQAAEPASCRLRHIFPERGSVLRDLQQQPAKSAGKVERRTRKGPARPSNVAALVLSSHASFSGHFADVFNLKRYRLINIVDPVAE